MATRKKKVTGPSSKEIKALMDAIALVTKMGYTLTMPLVGTVNGDYFESVPDDGAEKFYIVCTKLQIFTTIGADNKHHASNKATKLFGPHWSYLTKHELWMTANLAHSGIQFCDVKEFGRLIKTLQN